MGPWSLASLPDGRQDKVEKSKEVIEVMCLGKRYSGSYLHIKPRLLKLTKNRLDSDSVARGGQDKSNKLLQHQGALLL